MVRNVSSLIARSYNRPHVLNAFSIRLRAMLLLLDNFLLCFTLTQKVLCKYPKLQVPFKYLLKTDVHFVFF